MINLTVITLGAMLLAFFMVIYQMQKSSTRRRRIKQDLETLDLAKQLKCDTRESENLTALGLNPFFIKTEPSDLIKSDNRSVTTFATVILCLFLLGSIFLFDRGMFQSGALIFAYALTCVWGLIRARRRIREVVPEREKLIEALEQYELQLAAPVAAAEVAKAVPSVQAVSVPNLLDELYDIAKGYACVPQDSSLKRHFLSKVMADVETALAPKPTDSALKRHYCTHLKAEVEGRLQSLSAAPQAVVKPAVAASVVSAQVERSEAEEYHEHLPEDCTLRRHKLTQIKEMIISKLPPCPSDFNLKRHYNTMVQKLMEKEIEEHYS